MPGLFVDPKKLFGQSRSSRRRLRSYFKASTLVGASLPVTPLYGQVQGKKTVSAMLQSILSGKASVADASGAAASEMDAIFSKGS